MESAAKKLNSNRGASIILALVFLLVCVMVGSSVLMAAASNAGRSRSNRQEQQLYLVLSSALQVVADDLTGAQYTCQVKYSRWSISGSSGKVTYHIFDPGSGEMTREHGSGPMFADIFCHALDSISDGDIKKVLEAQYPSPTDPSEWEMRGDHYSYDDFISATKEPQNFTLTVTAAADGPLAEYTAEVDVKIDTNYRITLEAHLTGAPDAADEALKLFKNYYLTTTLTRSGVITSLTLPDGEDEILDPVTLSAGDTITWNAGKVLREYRGAGT